MKTTTKKKAVEAAQSLESVLEEEIELLRVGLEKAEKVRECIFNHDWEALTSGMEEMDSSSLHINELDRSREEAFARLCDALGVSREAGFYSVVVRLEPEERDKLSELFRRLKVEVLQLQGITWSIDAYVRSMSETIKDIIHTAFPHRRGTMYEKSGRQRAVGSDPMVVNRRL